MTETWTCDASSKCPLNITLVSCLILRPLEEVMLALLPFTPGIRNYNIMYHDRGAGATLLCCRLNFMDL